MSKSWPPLLQDTIGVLLPDNLETLFLRTCLGVGTRESWHRWQAAEPKLVSAVAGGNPAYKRLLPLLHHAVTGERVAVGESDLVLLRSGAAWEARRAARIDPILIDVLRALAAASAEPIVSKGVALARLAYPKPSLRHCHDVDLLVSPDQLERASAVLQRIGFSLERPKAQRCAARVLVHKDGLPVSLHVDLPVGGEAGLAFAETIGRSRLVDFAGQPARALDPADLLLLIAAQLVTGQVRDRTSWAVDAAFLLRHDDGLDLAGWSALAGSAGRLGLSIPLLAMLSYLRSDLEVAVPDATFAYLSDRAGREPARSRDRLLALLRRNPSIRFRDMVRFSGGYSRLDLARWIVFPSSTYLREWCEERGLPWSHVWYVARPLRRIIRRYRRALRRRARKQPRAWIA